MSLNPNDCNPQSASNAWDSLVKGWVARMGKFSEDDFPAAKGTDLLSSPQDYGDDISGSFKDCISAYKAALDDIKAICDFSNEKFDSNETAEGLKNKLFNLGKSAHSGKIMAFTMALKEMISSARLMKDSGLKKGIAYVKSKKGPAEMVKVYEDMIKKLGELIEDVQGTVDDLNPSEIDKALTAANAAFAKKAKSAPKAPPPPKNPSKDDIQKVLKKYQALLDDLCTALAAKAAKKTTSDGWLVDGNINNYIYLWITKSIAGTKFVMDAMQSRTSDLPNSPDYEPNDDDALRPLWDDGGKYSGRLKDYVPDSVIDDIVSDLYLTCPLGNMSDYIPSFFAEEIAKVLKMDKGKVKNALVANKDSVRKMLDQVLSQKITKVSDDMHLGMELAAVARGDDKFLDLIKKSK